MWVYANPNPCRQEEPDCVVRAISLATGLDWDEVHWDLCVLSHIHCTMPSVNWLWGMYLKAYGFERFSLPKACPECFTVREFAQRFPKGTYVIGTGSHAVCVKDGDWYDMWNSADEVPTYFYRKKEKEYA